MPDNLPLLLGRRFAPLPQGLLCANQLLASGLRPQQGTVPGGSTRYEGSDSGRRVWLAVERRDPG